MSDLATYDDYLQMADDRDDSQDSQFRAPDGYCEHGQYVGGCGVDYMCSWCEDGISLAEARRIVARERLAGIRERASRAATLLAKLLAHGVSGIDAAEISQDSSHAGNPLSRYGRH